jgi:hypothetical protein
MNRPCMTSVPTLTLVEEKNLLVVACLRTPADWLDLDYHVSVVVACLLAPAGHTQRKGGARSPAFSTSIQTAGEKRWEYTRTTYKRITHVSCVLLIPMSPQAVAVTESLPGIDLRISHEHTVERRPRERNLSALSSDGLILFEPFGEDNRAKAVAGYRQHRTQTRSGTSVSTRSKG